jgi:hypothetical protein
MTRVINLAKVSSGLANDTTFSERASLNLVSTSTFSVPEFKK